MERLNNALHAQVQKLGALTIGFDEVKAAHDASPCSGDVPCLTRLGARLGARQVLAGRVGKADGQMQIALQVVEVGSGTRRREVQQSVPINVPVDEAETRVRALAMEALAMDRWMRSAPLVVNAPVSGAEVLVDGVHQGTTPLFGPLGLAPGRREVEVRMEGLTSWHGFVDLKFDTPITIALEVQDQALVRNRSARERPSLRAAPRSTARPPWLVATGAGLATLGVASSVGAVVAWGVAADTHERVYSGRQLALVDDHQTAVTAYAVLMPTAVGAVVVGSALLAYTLLE